MQLRSRKAVTRVVALYALATAIGLSAALAGVKPASDTAFASHNCTRYGPFSYAVNTNCGVYDWFGNAEGFHTNGYAQRDSNLINVAASRWLWVWYDGLDDSTAYGVFLSIGSEPGQHKAYCTWNGGEVNGRCTTYWD
jgi:hypothetical protein